MFRSFFPKPDSSAKELGKINNRKAKIEEIHPLVSDIQEHDLSVRVAVYESLVTAPRTFDISSNDFATLVDQIAAQVYTLSHEKGGTLPYVALRELIENLIHADFKNAVITIMPDGNTVRISDQGPGISDKEKIFVPGFTTATNDMRKHIKGVGSGLPIVNESLRMLGGEVTVEDNLKDGAVITLYMRKPTAKEDEKVRINEKQDLSNSQSNEFEIKKSNSPENSNESTFSERPFTAQKTASEIDKMLSNRQKSVFLLIAEMGEIGPSTVNKELDMSLSTAHRDLVTLEELELITCIEGGKRKVTDKGLEYLGYIFD